jgi:hypothetical protein
MQYDLFSASAPQAVDLRTTPIPELHVAAAQVGRPEQWKALTLSQVLVKWEDLYADFIAVLEGPIHHAKEFCKDNGQPQPGGPVARKFYQREYERLVQGQGQLRAVVEGLFCENLEHAIEQGKAVLRAHGLSEDEAEDSHEFFNGIIQHPDPNDLGKLLPVLMQDVAQEYLRLAA